MAYNKSMEIMLKSGRLHDAAVIYSNIGVSCRENKELESALVYFKKSFELYKKLGLEKDAGEVEILIKSIKTQN